VPAGDATYAFNPAAKRFAEVEMDLRYLTEASPSRASHAGDAIADSHTLVDHYHYVLELDDDGTIIGGEYVGDTRRVHPDFLWLPQGAPIGTVAGVRYNEVSGLLLDSRQ
jgi:hypothetical protein